MYLFCEILKKQTLNSIDFNPFDYYLLTSSQKILSLFDNVPDLYSINWQIFFGSERMYYNTNLAIINKSHTVFESNDFNPKKLYSQPQYSLDDNKILVHDDYFILDRSNGYITLKIPTNLLKLNTMSELLHYIKLQIPDLKFKDYQQKSILSNVIIDEKMINLF